MTLKTDFSSEFAEECRRLHELERRYAALEQRLAALRATAAS
jgi:hypothetical protein